MELETYQCFYKSCLPMKGKFDRIELAIEYFEIKGDIERITKKVETGHMTWEIEEINKIKERTETCH